MKIARPYLLPLTPLFALAVGFRNWLFTTGRKKSVTPTVPTIGIGNLSVGGTGKTQVAAYFISQLIGKNQIALISRGYGRKTNGLLLENQAALTAQNFGDEPIMLKTKFPQITLAVSEKRALAVTQRELVLKCDLFILDDNFQHRHVTPQLQILLTTWQNPWFDDVLLPAGNLRESSIGRFRADIVLVTKSPKNASQSDLSLFRKNLRLKSTQSVFFTYQKYGDLLPLSGDVAEVDSPVLLVTGIANPALLRSFLKEKYSQLTHLVFPDHHIFKPADYHKILTTAKEIGTTHIITTEKDAARLNIDRLPEMEIILQPVEIDFINPNDEDRLWEEVHKKTGIHLT